MQDPTPRRPYNDAIAPGMARRARLLARHPSLLAHAAAVAVSGGVDAVRSDPALRWMGSMVNRRVADPSVTFHAGWGGLDTFVTTVRKVASPAADAVELGCGGGRATRELRRNVGSLVAVDIAESILHEASQATRDEPPIDFRVVEGFGENLPTATFDLAFSHDVFVHFDFDVVSRYTLNVTRALKPGGHFVVSVYTLDSEAELVDYANRMARPHALRPLRTRRMPTETYERIFATFGLQVVDTVRADASEYTKSKDFTHLNFVLQRPSGR